MGGLHRLPVPPDPSTIPTRRPGGTTTSMVLVLAAGGVLLGGVAVCGMFAAIAVPNFVALQMLAKRAELPATVEALRVAELAYHAEHDVYLAVSSEVEAMTPPPGPLPRDAPDDEGWDELGWAPDAPPRGAYWIEVEGDDFVVVGRCDVDGDGEYAEYRATRDEYPTPTTPPDVY